MLPADTSAALVLFPVVACCIFFPVSKGNFFA
jgi:hypothetical protein